MVAAACSTPHTADPTAPVLHAVIEQPSTQQAAARIFGPAAATRTSIDPAVQPHPILWSANDLISIHFNTDVNGARRVYVLSSGAGTQHADFTYTQIYDTSDTGVTISADPPTDFTSLFAGYPGEYVTISAQNSELLIEPPREIFLGLDDVDAFPMIGTGGADGSISFVCPFGMICLPVTGTTQIEAIYIDTSDQQAEISGRFSIDPQSYATSFVESVAGSQFFDIVEQQQPPATHVHARILLCHTPSRYIRGGHHIPIRPRLGRLDRNDHADAIHRIARTDPQPARRERHTVTSPQRRTCHFPHKR